MVEAVGLDIAEVRTPHGNIRFQSSDEMVATEVGATLLAQRLEIEVLKGIRRDSRRDLAPFGANGLLDRRSAKRALVR